MNTKIKFALASLNTLLMASTVFAGQSTIGIPSTQLTYFKVSEIGGFIAAILQILFIIAGLLVFIYLVWGGLQWLTSGGDSGATQSARDRITAALVGLAIIAIAYALMQIITYFFGLDGNLVGGTGQVVIPKPFQ